MKIAQGTEIEGIAASKHRGGSANYIRLIDGDDNSMIDNFSIIVARTPGRFSPRHRHNFEQFRFQLKGVANYGRTGKLKPGMLGYFPEGMHYGPQTQDESEKLEMIVMQCGGASGQGYPGRDATMRAVDELKAYGSFKDGVFTRNPGLPGKKNLDSFQAIWEHLAGRPMKYPKPRYDSPLLMHPDNLDWTDLEGQRGVAYKHMGTFTEYSSSAGFLRLEAGASHKLAGKRDLYVALKGAGSVGEQPLRYLTSLFLDFDEQVVLKATEQTELLHIRLPDLRSLKARLERDTYRQAAE